MKRAHHLWSFDLDEQGNPRVARARDEPDFAMRALIAGPGANSLTTGGKPSTDAQKTAGLAKRAQVDDEVESMLPWPPEYIDLSPMQHWWAGQGDVLYYLYSTRDEEVPVSTVQRAIHQLEQDLAKSDWMNVNADGDTYGMLDDLKQYVMKHERAQAAPPAPMPGGPAGHGLVAGYDTPSARQLTASEEIAQTAETYRQLTAVTGKTFNFEGISNDDVLGAVLTACSARAPSQWTAFTAALTPRDWVRVTEYARAHGINKAANGALAYGIKKGGAGKATLSKRAADGSPAKEHVLVIRIKDNGMATVDPSDGPAVTGPIEGTPAAEPGASGAGEAKPDAPKLFDIPLDALQPFIDMLPGDDVPEVLSGADDVSGGTDKSPLDKSPLDKSAPGASDAPKADAKPSGSPFGKSEDKPADKPADAKADSGPSASATKADPKAPSFGASKAPGESKPESKPDAGPPAADQDGDGKPNGLDPTPAKADGPPSPPKAKSDAGPSVTDSDAPSASEDEPDADDGGASFGAPEGQGEGSDEPSDEPSDESSAETEDEASEPEVDPDMFDLYNDVVRGLQQVLDQARGLRRQLSRKAADPVEDTTAGTIVQVQRGDEEIPSDPTEQRAYTPNAGFNPELMAQAGIRIPLGTMLKVVGGHLPQVDGQYAHPEHDLSNVPGMRIRLQLLDARFAGREIVPGYPYVLVTPQEFIKHFKRVNGGKDALPKPQAPSEAPMEDLMSMPGDAVPMSDQLDVAPGAADRTFGQPASTRPGVDPNARTNVGRPTNRPAPVDPLAQTQISPYPRVPSNRPRQ